MGGAFHAPDLSGNRLKELSVDDAMALNGIGSVRWHACEHPLAFQYCTPGLTRANIQAFIPAG
jgi:hypothetical protein